jgi:hypothetical protein
MVVQENMLRIIAPALSNKVLPVPSAFSNKLHPCSVLIKIYKAAYKPFKLALGSSLIN